MIQAGSFSLSAWSHPGAGGAGVLELIFAGYVPLPAGVSEPLIHYSQEILSCYSLFYGQI